MIRTADPAEAVEASFTVRGECCRDKRALFAEWARGLDFPAYFGHNWDALADSLTDIVLREPVTIVVERAGQLLADEPEAQWETFLGVVRDVAAARDDDQPDDAPRLVLILRDTPTALASRSIVPAT